MTPATRRPARRAEAARAKGSGQAARRPLGMRKAGTHLTLSSPGIDPGRIVDYRGLVSGEAVMGANIVRDLFAAVRDVVGVDLDYAILGSRDSMLMASANGTGVVE